MNLIFWLLAGKKAEPCTTGAPGKARQEAAQVGPVQSIAGQVRTCSRSGRQARRLIYGLFIDSFYTRFFLEFVCPLVLG